MNKTEFTEITKAYGGLGLLSQSRKVILAQIQIEDGCYNKTKTLLTLQE